MNQPRSLADEFTAWCDDYEEHLRRWPWHQPRPAVAAAGRDVLLRRQTSMLERLRAELQS